MKSKSKWAKLVGTAIVAAIGSTAWAEDWPNFRGPTGMGLSASKSLPLTWGGKSDENIAWKVSLLTADEKVRFDNNQSSPIVAGGAVYVTMSFWPAASTTKEFPEHHVVAFDASSGKRLWDTTVPPGPWLLSDLRGGYTAPTPAADGERVYTLFGSSVIAAIDKKGEIVWRKEIRPHSFDVAIGTSPVLYKDMVLVICEMTRGSRLIAFDKATGTVRFSQDREGADWTHATPVLTKVAGRDQLLVAGANALQGIDPDTGALIWWANVTDSPKSRIGDAPSPAHGAGVVYIDSGRGGPGISVDPTGTGDVTKSHVKWKSPTVSDNSLGSPLIVGDYLYRLQSPGVLKCFKLPGGELQYSERLQDATPAVSLFAAGDRIYLANAGKSFVVRQGPTFELLGTSSLGDSSQSSPAVANDRIYLRGRMHLYCIGK